MKLQHKVSVSLKDYRVSLSQIRVSPKVSPMKQTDYQSFKHKRQTQIRIKVHKHDNSKFLFYFKKNNKLYRKIYNAKGSTPANKKDDALRELEKFYNQSGNVRSKLNINITVNDYWKEFAERKLRENKWKIKTENTMQGFYKLYIKQIIGSRKVSSITTANIDNVMSNMSNKSKRLQKAVLEVLEPLFKRSIRDGLRMLSPIDSEHQVERNFREEKKVIVNPNDKFVKLYQAISNIKSIKIRTAFLLGFNGRRLQEVLTLQWQDIDISGNTYTVRAENNKVDTTMTYTLNGELVHLFNTLYSKRDSQYVFSSNRSPSMPMKRLSQYYPYIRDTTGLDEFTFHWMRNLLVSTLADNGVAPADLSAILGHNDTATIKKYLSLQRSNASKRGNEAVNKLLSSKQ